MHKDCAVLFALGTVMMRPNNIGTNTLTIEPNEFNANTHTHTNIRKHEVLFVSGFLQQFREMKQTENLDAILHTQFGTTFVLSKEKICIHLFDALKRMPLRLKTNTHQISLNRFIVII